ncbi:PilN domain-containing protein [Vibrio sp. SCSIO 43136]|uniref:PilN domain-containing protein n=1 Tax=Vibrio sp. SCSIO 43136 TaxID=2819101 RepID=UPI002074C493|nr:PilN domain-containing protein [Vibrio sp. SCSIO 43136]USD65497.1 PilN domain-containing protein [Vibrio sp. SCSIO 43136]
MQTINLLPWRDWQQQAYQRGTYLRIAMGLLVTAVIVVGYGYLNQLKVNQQLQRNQYLQSQIDDMNRQLSRLNSLKADHKKLQAKINLVTQLQDKRAKVPRFMSQIPNWIAADVYVDKIDMNDEHVTLTGFSKNTAAIASMLDNLETTPLAQDVKMHSIVSGRELFGQSYNNYSVSFVFDVQSQGER